MNKKPLVILTGPTAVGKTELSVKLAKIINAEIISADSMQVYKKMDIGTAKISKDEMEGVPHHMIDVFEPDEPFSVAVFCEYASRIILDIYSRGKIPLIVGGTGFYIQALLYGVDFSEGDEDQEYREFLTELADKEGVLYVHDMLKSIDPESAEAIHPNNLKRVIRALEYEKVTGKKISEHNKAESQKSSPYNFAYFVINDYRDILYERINLRVDKMVQDGLFDEVMRLKEMGYAREQSMLGIGYHETLEYFDSKLSREETIEKIKKETRHYAKKQLTWFKREKTVEFINKYDFSDFGDEAISHILKILGEKNIFPIQKN